MYFLQCQCLCFSLSLLLSRLWRESVSDALSPRPELWSHPVIDNGFGTAVRVVCSQRQRHLKLSGQYEVEKDSATISPCKDFDWSLEGASPFLFNLRELSLGNVSPETATMVAYLRSNVVSPVEVEMDVEQATAGTYICTHLSAHVYSTHMPMCMYVHHTGTRTLCIDTQTTQCGCSWLCLATSYYYSHTVVWCSLVLRECTKLADSYKGPVCVNIACATYSILTSLGPFTQHTCSKSITQLCDPLCMYIILLFRSVPFE